MLSRECTRTSIILAGKRDSHCYSTEGSSKNVVVTETSHQMLEVSSCDLTSIIKNNVFLVEKKSKMERYLYFDDT